MFFKKTFVYLFFLFSVSLFCAFLILAPYLKSIGQDFWAAVIYLSFHPACHQLPERSFFLFGYKMAVCQRCAAIYFGFLFSTLIYPPARRLYREKTPSRRLLIASLIPMGLDGGLQLIGIYESNPINRVVTGGLFGLALPFYVIPVYEDLAEDFFKWIDKKKKALRC